MIERLAREEMISANTVEHDLMSDVGMKSICEDLAEEALMRLRTSAYVTMEKDVSGVPVNGRSSVGEKTGSKAILAEIASLIELILDWKNEEKVEQRVWLPTSPCVRPSSGVWRSSLATLHC